MNELKVDDQVNFKGAWAIVAHVDEDGTVWLFDEDGGEHEATADQLD
jgi:hypothetical protein|tara:strand:- start:222 stop:362 length:141 start_codon:yes stop_codon:yes gene_type:complete